MESDDFAELYVERWDQIKRFFGKMPFPRMEFGDYPHFHTERGFAVTFFDPKTQKCSVRFAEKILDEGKVKIDAIIRHELAHVVDFLLSPTETDTLVGLFGFVLPKTPERRADAIASIVWKQNIFYDKFTLVQTLDPKNSYPVRPEKLGL